MEVATEAWRVKACFNPKHWVSGKHGRGDEKVVKKDDQQEEDRSPRIKEPTPKEPKPKKERVTLCFHNKKKRLHQVCEPARRSFATSCNDNLCTCCCLVARYIKEIFRMIMQ